MPWDDESILEERSFLSPRKFVSEYEFYLDGIATKIRVRIHKEVKPNVPSDPYHFSTSHYIHTPEQAGPYTPSAPWCGSEESALRRGVESIASYYRAAVENGHSPTESWLVAVDDF